ncbi:MAG: hypothetical protein D8G53_12615 [Candidatus Saccharimonas sp.]|nr:MAG: hypothetical protein D8G53_12615 [Candidatus Saccharimonas sp.]
MPRPKQKSPEQFIASSPIGEKLIGGVFERNLASGALRLIEINGKPQEPSKLRNKEEKVKETLESGYFGIIKPEVINPESKEPKSNELYINAEIEGLLIRRDEVPASYFELQRRIARERGYGDFELTDRQKEEDVKRLRADQKESLMRWSGYLRSKENGHSYPDWFKVYVWESLKKMGEFDEESGKFKKRTKSTVAPWPELNAEALSYVYDRVNEGVIQGKDIEDKQMAELLNRGNFAAMYAYAIYSCEVGGLTPELREITDGSWVKYGQIEGEYSPNYSRRRTRRGYEAADESPVDNSTAMQLAGSLQGKGTGWCTAGTHTAANQLSKGDFYVYCTPDNDDNDTMPRVAIRMEGNQVAEVRGIAPGQNVEDNLLDVVAEKLNTLPGGGEYYKKVEQMRRLTEIDNRVKAGGELTAEDLEFLWFGEKIKGFGLYEDSRVDKLLENRCREDDFDFVLRSAGDVDELADRMNIEKLFPEEISKLLELEANADDIASRMDHREISHLFSDLASAGADMEAIAHRLFIECPEFFIAHLKSFIEAGVKEVDDDDAIARLLSRFSPVSLRPYVHNAGNFGHQPHPMVERYAYG